MTRPTWIAIVLVAAACGGKPAPTAAVDKRAAAPDPDAPAEVPPDPAVDRAIAAARAQRDAGDRAACVETLRALAADERVGAAAQGQAALALMKDCSGRTEDSCDYYLDLAEDDAAYCELALAVELGPRRAYDDAAPSTCGFPAPEGAVALPGDPDRCLALIAGDGIALEDLPEDGADLPAGVCPTVVVVDRAGGSTPIERDGPSYLDDASTCCAAGVLRTRLHGDDLELVVESGGPSRDCFGGTASVDQFQVFRLDGARLRAIVDLAVGMH